ncbi:MAG: hypothetical protein KDA21_00265 [Phycisphaerales bacterium]|nr:hypothetical protein [Phycisphaerales bacterium]
MKYKTLFRLAVKYMGLWIIVSTSLQVLQILWLVVSERLLGFQDIIEIARDNVATGTLVIILAELGLGLYFFFGGEWIVNLAIPGNRSYCHECGYEQKDTTGNACPECGVAFRADGAA